jgi:two-component system probable response regulator PhcQ
VHTAADARAGLAILEEHGDQAIGVLITDQRMPGLSGVDLLKKARKRWPHIVRLLTTAYSDLDDAIEAINRGEIFRYITKPWNIKALRAEMSQALSVFDLQREHAELMREKVGVWQRLVQLGRARDLIVMGGSLSHLRHSENAIAAYLMDHLAPEAGPNLAAAEYLDLWRLTEAEIGQTLTFVREILARTAPITGRSERFDTRLPPDRLLKLGGGALAAARIADGDRPPAIRVAERPAALLFEELARASAPDGAIQLQTVDNGTAVSLSLTAGPAPDGLTAREAAGLLTAYLMAFHHGGNLELEAASQPWQYVLTLPVEPDAITLPPPEANWLESLFVRLENWG